MLSIMTPYGLAEESMEPPKTRPESSLEKAGAMENTKAPESAGVMEDVSLLWQEVQGLSHDRLKLAALETRQAGESLVSMVMAGMMLVGMLCCAWLGLMAVAVLTLIENGLLASSAILLAVAFNLVLVLILQGVIRRKSFFLQFPATVRSLEPKPSTSREAAKS